METDPAPDFLHVALAATARHAPSATKRLRALGYLKARLDATRKSRGAGPAAATDGATVPRSDVESRFN